MRQHEPPGGTGAGGRSDPGHPDTEEIRVEIEQTRTEMSGTIDAIQQKLDPDALTEHAKDVARDATDQAKAAAQELIQDTIREVKDAALEITEHAVQDVKQAAREVTGSAKEAAWDATVGRAEDAVSTAGETARGVGSMVIETIKQNPLPAALAGISLAWLYMKRPAGSASTGAQLGGTGYRTPGSYQGSRQFDAYAPRTGYATTEGILRDNDTRPPSVTVGSTGSAPRQTGQREDGGMVSELAGQAGELASDVAGRVASGAGQMVDSTTELASTAGGTVMDTGSEIMDLIRRNPVPAALVGLGLGWLYLNRSSGTPDYRAHAGTHYRYGPRTARSGSGYVRGSGHQPSGTEGGVGDVARQVGDQVGEVAGSLQDQAGELAGAALDYTTHAPGQIQRMIEDNPWMTAALAASLGAAVGLALPRTQPEDQVMGSTRDYVVDRAQEMTSETIEKVQSVAQEVQSTVSEQATAQGLTV